MAEYHEPVELLPEEIRDHHRAIKSLMEELEAVDWYQQRVSASREEALQDILAHHRDEEVEHACMLLEWIRRRYPAWDENLRKYLFTEAPVIEVERAAEAAGKPRPGDLGLRNLTGGR
jgi:uncharacterized protein